MVVNIHYAQTFPASNDHWFDCSISEVVEHDQDQESGQRNLTSQLRTDTAGVGPVRRVTYVGLNPTVRQLGSSPPRSMVGSATPDALTSAVS